MKILFILPVFAIVFFAFAKPDYQYVSGPDNQPAQNTFPQTSDKKVKGIVIYDGTPLPGASIIVAATTIGTSSDDKGFFSIDNVPENGAIVVSFVGFKSKVIKADFTREMRIEMTTDTISYLNSAVGTPPPPPPPPAPPLPLKIKNTNGGPPPLVVLDGVITDKDVNTIDQETIESITVLKDKSATSKYGDKGKDGVIEITSKKKEAISEPKEPVEVVEVNPVTGQNPAKEDLFVAVEELPEFSGGGRDAMRSWISQNLKYPGEAYNKKITGKVNVGFLVTATGKVKNVQVIKSVNPLLDAEAIRVISTMPDWKPGTQHGKEVPVQMKVQVEFKLP